MGLVEYSEIVNAIYAAAVEPSLWSHAIERMSANIGGIGGILVQNNMDGPGSFLVTGGLRHDLGELYLERHVRNPWTEGMLNQPTDRPLSGNAVVEDPGVVRKTEYHADILAPQRIADMICLPTTLFSGPHSTGGIAVALSPEQTDDTAGIISRFDRFTPHLVRSLDLSSQLSRWRDDQRRMDVLLQSISGAAMLLDPQGRLLQTNREADDALRLGSTLRVRIDRRLVPGRASTLAGRELDRFIAQALGARDDERGRVRHQAVVHRRDGSPPYLLLATPLPRGLADFWETVAASAHLLLQLVDPLAQPTADERLLREAFGLTATEALVAKLVARGLSTPRVATELGVRITTVRSHLARCFDKLGVNSQVDLARLLATISLPKSDATG